MKLSGFILKFMRNCIKLSELVYHTQKPSNKPFSEHVLFVQICLVFAGPITYMRSCVFKVVVHTHTYVQYNIIIQTTIKCI